MQANYHYISFSWLIGGIIEYATRGNAAGGDGFRSVVEERVASRIGSSGEMFIGGVPHARLEHASRLVPPPAYAPSPNPLDPAPLLFFKRLLAAVECRIFVTAGNSRRWREVCLPSSNGWFTSRSVARMYAALVNGGQLGEGEQGNRLVSDRSANLVLNIIGDNKCNVASTKVGFPPPPSQRSCRPLLLPLDIYSPAWLMLSAGTQETHQLWWQGDARLSCGFSPWLNPEIHAPEEDQVTINANGGAASNDFPPHPLCARDNTLHSSPPTQPINHQSLLF